MKKFLTSKIDNILLCIAEIIVGVLLLVNPDAVTSAFIIGAGAVMILTGIVFCTLYFVGEAEKMVIKQLLFKGLLLIILGVLCVTQYGVLLAALPFVTWVYAIAMLILAAYKVQCAVDILRLSGIRWYFPAISAALAVVLALFILPFFIQQNFGIQLPTTLEIIILLFIFAAEILGELEGYFITCPNWDTMLHTTTGFLCAATGFALIDILNRNSRIKFQLSPIYVALAAFCFSMTVGVLWEFFEFGMDRLFHLDMQKDTVVQSITSVMLDPTNSNTPVTIDGIHSVAVNGNDLGFDGYLDIGLYDTMEDLFVNFIGAVTFSVIGYFYIKHRGKGKLARAFIPTLSEQEEQDPAAPDSSRENSK